MIKKYISIIHFIKYLTCQPFFVWNSLKNKENFEIDEDNDLWDILKDEVLEIKPKSYGQIIAKSFYKIDKHLFDHLKKTYDCVFITGKTIEEKIRKTRQNLNSEKMLIKPVFIYENAVACPTAFDAKEKTLINLKYSKKTRLDYLIDFKWQSEIVAKSTEVKNFKLFILREKLYEKNEISLVSTDKIHPTKTGSTFKINFHKLKKISFLINRKMYFNNEKIEEIIKNINAYQKIKTFDLKIDKDITNFGENKEIDLILEKKNFEFAQFSGKVIKKKAIKTFLNQTNSDAKSFFSSKVLDQFLDLKKQNLINYLFLDSKQNLNTFNSTIKKIQNANKVIWYDFEGFSLPFSPLTGYGPYDQVIFQVSIIKTVKNVENGEPINIVFDPQNISYEDFFEIVKNIYSEDGDCYVVYNRSYEIKKMKKMLEVLRKQNYEKTSEFEKMFNHIEQKTVDLMDLFKILGKNKVPPVMLSDQKLKYSIKNIEKHISQNNIHLPRKIQEYKNLEIQNGLIAMEIAIKRSINIIGDLEWKSYEKKLKKYCENDVRAMIMVYDFVLSLKNKYYKNGETKQ